ncbi:MAG: ABC transporter permease [Gemmatimonadaceae bacterium]|nr:ABC transporter permease [Gemmatimonadaceae bacterium]
MHQLVLALRTLRKTPFVTSVAVLSLALGIGANAAIFSLFDQMLLRALPVPNAEQLVSFGAPGPKPGSQSCNQSGDCEAVFSYQMFRDLEQQQRSFTGLAGHFLTGGSFAVRGEPLTGEMVFVSGSYFPVLGITPAAGRLLGPADDEVIGAHAVVVISHEFWSQSFGADPRAVGQSLVINGRTFTVIGVAPEGFSGTTLGARPKAFVPLTMRTAVQPWTDYYTRRNIYALYVFGRLKPGVSLEQARTATQTIYSRILRDVELPLQEGMSDQTRERFARKSLAMEMGARGQSSVHGQARTPLLMLFGVTGTVLLIACANIANLLLARGAGRATEMGVRLALGATRRHLLVQLLTESLLLASFGGVVSLLVASWTLKGIAALLPAQAATAFQFTLQPSVMLFAAAVALGTGLLVGLFPALHSTRADLISTIRAGAGQIAGARGASRFRAVMVTVQVALSMALLVSAGLFLKSLVNVSRVDLGVPIADMYTFSISPGNASYDSTRSAQLFRQVHDELRAMPGVTAVTESRVPLLAGSNWGNDVRVQGFAHGPDVDANSRFNSVGAGYFGALGVRLVSGRDFSTGDVVGSQKVAIVNETFARKFGLGRDAVGKFMSEGEDSLDIQIVGLVPDIKYSDVKDTVPPVFYRPWAQNPRITELSFYVRTTLPPAEQLGSARALLKRLAPTVPVEEIKTMPQQVRENVFLDRVLSILSTAFALLATLLASVGLYGVLAYSVAQRTREIGVRMALGADGTRIKRLILTQVVRLTLVGTAIGVAAALGLGRAARSLLFGLEGHDPVVFIGAVSLLSVIALAAGYLPALRAASVDPMRALRVD